MRGTTLVPTSVSTHCCANAAHTEEFTLSSTLRLKSDKCPVLTSLPCTVLKSR